MLELIERNPERNALGANGEQTEFCVLEDRVLLARALTGVDHLARRITERREGYFARLYLAERQDAAALLFEAIGHFQRAMGSVRAQGPVDPDGGFLMGVRTEGFRRVEPLTADNPPYYDLLLRGCSLRSAREWLGFEMPLDPKRHLEAGAWAQRRMRLQIESCDLRRGRAQYEALRQAGGYEALGLSQFAERVDAIRRQVEPRYLLLAKRDGAPVGLLMGIRQGRSLRIATIHVRESYRRTPVALALYSEALSRAREDAIGRLTASMIDAENRASVASALGAGGVECARWREYQMEISKS